MAEGFQHPAGQLVRASPVVQSEDRTSLKQVLRMDALELLVERFVNAQDGG